MKARKGDPIVCDCPTPAGAFRRDVEDGAPITGDDFAVNDYEILGPESDGGLVCSKCHSRVK
ncbi:MAG: hypothetical protein WDM85_01250 [Caulobacteraceae bacterium]